MAIRQFLQRCALIALVSLVGAGSAPAQTWDGSGTLRYGVFLQGSSVAYDITTTATNGSLLKQSAAPSAFGVGMAAGYDLRLGAFVMGIEGDASFDGGGAKAKPSNGTTYGVDFLATVRARFGYVVSPDLLVYGTGGVGLHGIEAKNETTTIAIGARKTNATLGGFVYGAGVDYNIGWGLAFVEYLHHDLGAWTLGGGSTNKRSIDGTQDVVRFGLKFKVGHDYTDDVYRRR